MVARDRGLRHSHLRSVPTGLNSPYYEGVTTINGHIDDMNVERIPNKMKIYLVTFPEHPWIVNSSPAIPDYNQTHVMVYERNENAGNDNWSFLCKPESFLILPRHLKQHGQNKFPDLRAARRISTCKDCKSFTE